MIMEIVRIFIFSQFSSLTMAVRQPNDMTQRLLIVSAEDSVSKVRERNRRH